MRMGIKGRWPIVEMELWDQDPIARSQELTVGAAIGAISRLAVGVGTRPLAHFINKSYCPEVE